MPPKSSKSPKPPKPTVPPIPATEITISLLGLGHAGRAFLRLLIAKRRWLMSTHGVAVRLTAVATRAHGLAVSRAGIDMARALHLVESGRSLAPLNEGRPLADTLDLIRRRPARILFEITPLNPFDGMPAVEHIRTALELGAHVVTANKGPVAVAYRELRGLARSKRRQFRFEGTVMDGAPIFNLVEKTLPGTEVLGFRGILNSTTNLILTEMEKGRSYESALGKARALGITEADPSYDVSGWDAATKTAVLANVLMGADILPADVSRQGIATVHATDLERARKRGKVLRLVARASRDGRKVKTRVAPMLVNQSDPLAHVSGTSSALVLQTDTMNELTVIENEGGVKQTAYALFSDLVAIVTAGGARREEVKKPKK